MTPIAIEFTSTECVRPEIAQESYQSFYENLGGIDWGKSILYLNIDPVPNDRSPIEVVRVAEQFFGHIKVNITDEPNFCKAVKWAWTQPIRAMFFHLEADWVLSERVDVRKLIGLLESDEQCCAVNLRAYPGISKYVCLSPGLHRATTAKIMADRLDAKYNPERQLRPKCSMYPEGGKALEEHYAIHWPKKAIVKDIGREWLDNSGLSKDGGKEFNRWQ